MLKDERFYLEKAQQQYNAASHLLQVTFPLIKDPRLLMGILTNIFSSLEAGMEAVLSLDLQLKLFQNEGETFQQKLAVFRARSASHHKINSSFINLIADLQDLLVFHKKSPIEFQRGNKFVLCSSRYNLRALTPKEIKEYLEQNKAFLNIVETILDRKQ